ncbi:MAG: spermidine/putrescine ABC transporter substrate-binding protein [Kiritimatiellae bacterium]|nr:spermidine/putrescine ABC transporter substrate-binding protein [Kiritimatiellia bacterium]
MKNANIAIAAAAAAIAAGCAGSGSDPGVDLSAQALAAAKASGLDTDSAKGAELHVYTWSDYIAPDVVLGFENALGCKVVIDTFESNEAMYAKLKAGGNGYDIVTPTSYQIGTMAASGMIVPIEHARVPNLAGFDERFASQILDSGFKYNIPYAVTYTGLVYRKDKLPEGADPATWEILSNPALKGRVTLLDDIREVIGAGLMSLGYSVNSTDPAQIDAAVERVLSWRGNTRKFDAESYKTEVPSGATYLGHGYSTDAVQVIVGDEEEGIEPRPDVGFALPVEGFTIGVDEMVLSAEAPRPDLAYAFMNYLYDGDVACVNMEYVCGPMPVKAGIEKLDDDYRAIVIPDDETIARGQVLRGFEDDPAAIELYNKAWDRIKATDAR